VASRVQSRKELRVVGVPRRNQMPLYLGREPRDEQPHGGDDDVLPFAPLQLPPREDSKFRRLGCGCGGRREGKRRGVALQVAFERKL
jgi:hypothetical protein